MKRIFICISLFLQVSFVSAESKQDTSVNQSKKIGIIMGQTGGAAFHAAAVKEGIDLAVEELKSAGKTIDLLWEDDQTSPAKAVSAVHSLSARGYKLLIGPLWSFQIKAVIPVLRKEKLLSVIPTGASDIIGGPSGSVFNMGPPRAKQLAALLEWFKSHPPGKTIAHSKRRLG